MWIKRENCLIEFPRRKAASLLCLVLILASFFASFSFLPKVRAETVIASLSPSGGVVGTIVDLMANLTTANGTFQVLWDNNVLIPNGVAVGNSVNVTFTVPAATSGSHAIVLIDVAKGENSTVSFGVSTAYSFDVLPKLVAPAQSQEGDSFQFSLNMTGGDQGKTNVANVTVEAPNNASYSDFGNIATGNDGSGILIMNYPGDFGGNTNFTGQYSVFFNGTLEWTFSVGLTNSSEYHRNQALDIKAAYASGENVILTLTGNALNYSESLTADMTGIVHYVNSTILSSAPASSTYTVNLTSASGPTSKAPPDVQIFTVPGLAVNITTRNLAGEPVPNLSVQVFENSNSVYNLTSNANGTALSNGIVPMLEVGNYVCNASLGNQEIGRRAIAVDETSTTFDLYCNLTNLIVVVRDEDGVMIPDVALSLADENRPTSALTLQPTDVNGTSIAHSILPLLDNAPISYVLNASRYGTVFNTTAHLQLPVIGSSVLSIVCPKENLLVNVVDGSGQPISNANVSATEAKGGLFYSNTTLADGNTIIHATFGRYLVQVYVNGIELNETTVDLNITTVNVLMNCALYGLSVSVRISDYFGQSVPNLNVTLQRTGYQKSIISGSDGLAVFNNIVGGDLQLSVRQGGESSPIAVETVSVDNAMTVDIRLGKYLVLAGMLVETGPFVTVMMIVLTVIFIICLEVYMKRRAKPKKSIS